MAVCLKCECLPRESMWRRHQDSDATLSHGKSALYYVTRYIWPQSLIMLCMWEREPEKNTILTAHLIVYYRSSWHTCLRCKVKFC